MRTVYQLKPKELAEIEKAIRQDKRAEVRQRATVIRLLHLGQKPETIAEQQMVSVPTVQLAQTLAREWACGTSQQSASRKKAQSHREVLSETRSSAE